jgi:hypothetical protein
MINYYFEQRPPPDYSDSNFQACQLSGQDLSADVPNNSLVGCGGKWRGNKPPLLDEQPFSRKE